MKPSHPFSFLHQQRNAAHLVVTWPQVLSLGNPCTHTVYEYDAVTPIWPGKMVTMGSRGSRLWQHASHCPLRLLFCSITGASEWCQLCLWMLMFAWRAERLVATYPQTHTHTDAQGFVNDSLGLRMCVGCLLGLEFLPASPLCSSPLHPPPAASLLQPAGKESVAPYGARKINNEEKISTAAGGRFPLSSLFSAPNKIQRCREGKRERIVGVIKLMGFNTLTQHRRQYLHRMARKKGEISPYCSVKLWYYKSDPGLSILRPCFINVH